MGDLAEFSLPVQLILRAYPWRRIDPVPWAPLRRPLAECRVALVSSAGFIQPGQQPFDETIKGGDWSFRELPSDVDVSVLKLTHRSQSFDHAAVESDPNVAFPIDRLRELKASGRIGSINRRHFSVMGSIVAPGRFTRDTTPAIARALAADQVEVALLVPV